MRYSLWSHRRLVGHTSLDLPCVQNEFLQGFLEPAPEGAQALLDATGVILICAGQRVAKRPKDDAYFAAFARALDRFDELNFVLRDESGKIFACEFIRIYDLFDRSWQTEDESDDQQVEALWKEPVADDDTDSDLLAEMRENWSARDDFDRYGSMWRPQDDRWHTMQYYIQVFLKA